MITNPCTPDFGRHVPDDLLELDHWVLWRYEERGGKPTKVPYQRSGRRASSTDPRTWSSFEDAFSAWSQRTDHFAGVGFVFTKEDPFVGIDLDRSLDDAGTVKEWAAGVVERFADTYSEISPSGRGLKIWARGSLPANLPGVRVGDGTIEMYSYSRFFTVTGNRFHGAPLEVEDHADDLLCMYERLACGRKHWVTQPEPGGRIPHGQQHNTLVSICGTLRARGICDEAIEACLQAVNARQCERPGSTTDIGRIVASSRKWGAR